MELSEQVKRGVELLDREIPDWREKIETARLEMSDCHRCILGQLFTDEYNERVAAERGGAFEGLFGVPSPYTIGSWFLMDHMDQGFVDEFGYFPGEMFGFEIDTHTYGELEEQWLYVLNGGK